MRLGEKFGHRAVLGHRRRENGKSGAVQHGPAAWGEPDGAPAAAGKVSSGDCSIAAFSTRSTLNGEPHLFLDKLRRRLVDARLYYDLRHLGIAVAQQEPRAGAGGARGRGE